MGLLDATLYGATVEPRCHATLYGATVEPRCHATAALQDGDVMLQDGSHSCIRSPTSRHKSKGAGVRPGLAAVQPSTMHCTLGCVRLGEMIGPLRAAAAALEVGE